MARKTGENENGRNRWILVLRKLNTDKKKLWVSSELILSKGLLHQTLLSREIKAAREEKKINHISVVFRRKRKLFFFTYILFVPVALRYVIGKLTYN
jgi:hypothetical protein